MTTPLTKPSLQAQSATDPADAPGDCETAPDLPRAVRAGRGPGPAGHHRKNRMARDHRRIGPPIPRGKTGRRPRRDARMGYPARRRDGDWMTLRRVKEPPHRDLARSRKDPIDQGLTSESEDEDANDDTATS